MNRLLTPNGGMPLELDDFNFIQDAYKEALKGVLSEFSNRVPTSGHPNTYGNFIISGCEVTDIGGGNSSVSAGFVFIDGEVLYAPAVTSISNTSLPNAAYRILAYNDPDGNELFEDGFLKDTYQIRRSELFVLGAAPTVKVVYLTPPEYRYCNLITHKDVVSLYDVNLDGTLSNSWAGVNDGGTGVYLKATKQFSVVRLRGQVFGGSLGGAVVATLASGYRPKVAMYFLCSYGADGIARVDINNANGEITVTQIVAPSGVNTVLDLSCISFTTE